MTDLKYRIWDVLSALDGETVVRLLTDYYGTDLLSGDFAEFLADEGYMEADDA